MRQWEAASPPFYKCNLPPHAITVIKTEGATLKIDGSNKIGCPYWQGRTRLRQYEVCVWRREDGANECWQILGIVHKVSYNCERDAYWPAGRSIHSKQSYVRAHCSSLKPFSLVAAYKSEAGWLDPRERSRNRKCNSAWSTRSFKISASHYEIVYWDLTPSMLCMRYILLDHHVLRCGFRPILCLRKSLYEIHLVIYEVKAAIFQTLKIRSYMLTLKRGQSRKGGMTNSRSSRQNFWLQIQRSQVWFPGLPDFLRSRESATGSTQPREGNWGTTWMKK
jgi:hypothetical protein